MTVTESTEESLPATQSELSRWLAENAAGAGRPVYPVGGRTALHYGYPVTQPGMTLSTTKLTQVIDYPARDMTVTVEAGIRIDELAALLRKERQRLPIDVAQSHRATLGGAVATNTSGPRRFGLGTLRDYVIGISAVDATGNAFKAGGRVVKNVAGYDLCKMLIGSLGTLAVITQLTLKLRPEPETSTLLWASFDRWAAIDQALQRLLNSAARPIALEVLDPRAAATIALEAGLELPCTRPVLCIGVEGTSRETEWQTDTLANELSSFTPREVASVKNEDAKKLWFALTEFQVSSEEPGTFQANLLPSRTIEFVSRAEAAGVALQGHAGNGIVVGHLSDQVASLEAARDLLNPLREFTRNCGGNLILLNCYQNWKKELPLFGDAEPSWPLMKKLKAELDPRGLLNPGRFL